MANPLRIYGVRHHGPGCARSLALALAQEPPDIILVEGPPEADGLLSLLGEADLQPPVALLVYALDDPAQASFYPFAEFSPEWQALKFANQQAIPLRFFDLPASARLAQRTAEANQAPATTEGESEGDSGSGSESAQQEEPYRDPLDHYAKLTGYADGESWWDALIEQRQHGGDLFALVLEAMRDLRASTPSL